MSTSVRCFAGLRIEANGTQLAFSQRKAKALIAYLALVQRPVSRAVLADLLWDDLAESRARGNLRVLLSSARRTAKGLLLTHGDEVGLDHAFLGQVDVVAFERATESGRWDRAVDLYRGPLLDGFFVDRARRFEDWVARQREQLQRSALFALQARVDELQEWGRTPEAVATLGRIVALEPWHEGPRRQLMDALARAGRAEAAIDEYRRLRQQLADDLGTAPGTETIRLVERIASDHQGPRPVGPIAPVPPTATPIVGRGQELRTIETLLVEGSVSLITLTGPGGVGKSRLAHEAIYRLQARGGSTTAFVDLSGVAAAAELPNTLGAALRIPLLGLREPIEEIAAALQGADTVVALDNLEHLLPDVAGVVADLLAHCPGLRVLGTSRTRLGLWAERVQRVLPLALPEGDQAPTASPAVALFLQDRAEAIGVAVTPGSLGDVVALCRQLDGLPLALELAALHLRYFTPGEALAMFGVSLEEMRDTGIERPSRHRTLLDSIAWSYRMLDPCAQRLLRYLGVFRKGISLGAFQQAMMPSVVQGRSSLVSLLEHGLLDRRTTTGETRLTMMESTRIFALRELEAHGEAADARARHAAAHLALADRANGGIKGPDQVSWLNRLDRESDNLSAALRHSISTDPPTALRLANALTWYWHIRGHFREGVLWLAEVLATGAGGPHDRARARLNASLLSIRRGEGDVDGLIDQAEKGLAALRDQVGLAEVRHVRALRTMFGGAPGAGDISEIVDSLSGAIAVLERQGESWEVARLQFTLAAVHYVRLEPDLAVALAQESAARFDRLGDRRGRACAQMVVGTVHTDRGDTGLGWKLLRQALADLIDVGDYVETVNALHALGFSLIVVGEQIDLGARLLGAGTRLSANSKLVYSPVLQAHIDRFSVTSRATIGQDAWQRAWDEGWQSGMDLTIPD